MPNFKFKQRNKRRKMKAREDLKPMTLIIEKTSCPVCTVVDSSMHSFRIPRMTYSMETDKRYFKFGTDLISAPGPSTLDTKEFMKSHGNVKFTVPFLYDPNTGETVTSTPSIENYLIRNYRD